jgi:hypothetical protein
MAGTWRHRWAMNGTIHDIERAHLERRIEENPVIAQLMRSRGDFRLAELTEKNTRAIAGLLAAIDSKPILRKEVKKFLMRIESLDYEMKKEAKYDLSIQAIKDRGENNILEFPTKK